MPSPPLSPRPVPSDAYVSGACHARWSLQQLTCLKSAISLTTRKPEKTCWASLILWVQWWNQALEANHDTSSCLLQAGDSQMVLGAPMGDQAAVMQAGMGVGDPAHQQASVHQVGLV